jgi:hypothetical protein
MQGLKIKYLKRLAIDCKKEIVLRNAMLWADNPINKILGDAQRQILQELLSV